MTFPMDAIVYCDIELFRISPENPPKNLTLQCQPTQPAFQKTIQFFTS